MLDAFTSHRFLDRFEYDSRIIIRPSGKNEKMNVFGHENVSPNCKIPFSPRFMNGFSEPYASALGFQEGIASKAAKGEFMGVVCFINSGSAHGTQVPIHRGFLCQVRFARVVVGLPA